VLLAQHLRSRTEKNKRSRNSWGTIRVFGVVVNRSLVFSHVESTVSYSPVSQILVVLNSIDVRDNVSSIQKQLEDAQLNLHGISVISSSNVRNNETLQVTEIYEELDEEGNVTCPSPIMIWDARA